MDKGYEDRVLLVRAFLEFERHHDAFNRNACGLHYWHLLRKWLFDSVSKQVRSFEFGGHPDFHSQFSFKNVAKKMPRLAKQVVESHRGLKSVVESGKRVVFLGNWKKTSAPEGVCNVFLEDLGRSFASECAILERPHGLTHVKDSLTDLTIYTDYLEFRWFAALALGRWRKESKAVFSDVLAMAELLEREFDVELDKGTLEKRTAYVVAGYFELSDLLISLFSVWRPACVVEVEHYSVFCLVCNEVLHGLGIPVIELQHGQIGPGHIAYNLDAPGCERFLPDRIAAFGQYWIDQCNIPDKDRRMLAIGSIPLERGLRRNFASGDEEADKRPVVLIVSQGYDGGAVSAFACGLADDARADEYRIIVKLHPSERESWKTVHPRLAEMGSRVEVAESGDIDWHLRRAKIVVGISSTVLFEALAYEKRVFILDAVDSEIARPLLQSGAAELVKGPDDFMKLVLRDSEPLSDELKAYFWPEGACCNVEHLIKGYL